MLKSTIYIAINRWLHDISFGFDTCLVNCHFWRSLGVKSSAAAKNWRTCAGLSLCCCRKAISIEPTTKKGQLENETARKNSNCLTFVAQLICDWKIKSIKKTDGLDYFSYHFFLYIVTSVFLIEACASNHETHLKNYIVKRQLLPCMFFIMTVIT